MKREPLTMREGFWETSEPGSCLPTPIPREKPWKGQQEFLSALDNMEMQIGSGHAAQIAERPLHKTYRGWSECRICGKKNGSGKYSFYGWEWPNGFRHYVEAHNVRPSLAFQEFVLGRKLQ